MSKSIVLTDCEARCPYLRYLIRPVKDAPDNATSCLRGAASGGIKFFSSPLPGVSLSVSGWINSSWQPGDKLTVRESWSVGSISCGDNGSDDNSDHLYIDYGAEVLFKSQMVRSGVVFDDVKWNSPATMPLIYASRWLLVEAVACKRVEDVTEDEAKGNGCHSRTYRDGRGYEPATIEFLELWRKHYSAQWAWIAKVREVI